MKFGQLVCSAYQHTILGRLLLTVVVSLNTSERICYLVVVGIRLELVMEDERDVFLMIVAMTVSLGDGEAIGLPHFTFGRKHTSSDLTRPGLIGRQRKWGFNVDMLNIVVLHCRQTFFF